MRKLFRAEKARTLSFAPGRSPLVLSEGKARTADAGEAMRTNNIEHAPVERFDTRFLETMRGLYDREWFAWYPDTIKCLRA